MSGERNNNLFWISEAETSSKREVSQEDIAFARDKKRPSEVACSKHEVKV